MTRGTFLVVLLVLVCGTPMSLAQSRGAKTKPDPVSGAWTGALTPSGGDRGRSITLALKYDGKSKVTGTLTGLPNPGDVKAGTFDPKTGALALKLGIEGDSVVRLVLDGTVTKNTASGKVTGEMTGEFTLTRKP